jgi:Nif-specific regulatory protein
VDQRQLELERDLYRLLLDAKGDGDASISSLLSDALDLIMQITGARIGFIELRNDRGDHWWSTHRCNGTDIQTIRERISSGIIAEALANHRAIVTPSAFLDPRFSDLESVKSEKIEAVLCAPFGDGSTIGFIYLQSDGGIELSSSHCMMDTDLFVRQVTPLLRRFKRQIAPQGADNSRDLRKKYDLDAIVGESEVLRRTLFEAMAIAELDVSVLLTGESGTGKGLLADAIHRNSPRKNKPFVHLNCANLPEQLVESELFGSARGAHSSAYYEMKGKIAAAQGGTLFLDEIGELPLAVQSKLLQFLEEGSYFPLGSQTPVHADVRVITASNIDFQEALKNRAFRPDLYYRICVFPLEMPQLRARIEDIPLLALRFCEKYSKQFKIPHIEYSPEALLVLQESDWPGNVRQLENKIQQGILRAKADGSSQVRPLHLIGREVTTAEVPGRGFTYRQGKDIWERRFIQNRLEKHGWNVSETAKSLGLSRSHMNNLISVHALQRTEQNGKKKFS